ncbi:hypothetical protein F2Q70_00039488 [Brassica cretica]|uniref:Uncharacterized protein n=1 Tax=Brassica cretica TaxID=69181 RepID=A0A8S9KAF8_BRACR|nr:hypothetical protein F2Q70_00039488 [Brassica cretica]
MKQKVFRSEFKRERKGGAFGGSNSPDCEPNVVHPTCFYRKISTETPIEIKRKVFRSEFKLERKGGALGGCSNCLTHQTGELDDSFGPTRRMGELDGAFGPT